MMVLVNSGIYDAHEVAHLLAVDVEQVVRWSTPDAKGRPAIVAPSQGRSFSFLDLVSLSVVATLRHRGIADRAIRSGVRALRQEHDLAQPLAHRAVLDTVGTSGTSFVAQLPGGWYDVGAGTQGAFESVVRVYFSALTYDEIGVASAWRPFEHVTLDPRIQAGAPCVTGTRIPTATIARVLESEPAEEIAQEYGITIDEVEAADKFEQQLIDGHGLAA